MNFIFEPRLSLFDSACTSAMAILLYRGQWMLALGIAIIGVLFSQLTIGAIALRAMNKQWQCLVPTGNESLVPAIKKHRELFNTGLKEAVDAVRAYRDNKK